MSIELNFFFGKSLDCGLDGSGSIPGVGGMEGFLHSFVYRLSLGPLSLL